MKNALRLGALFIGALAVLRLHAQIVPVFTRYNYFLSSQEGIVVAVLPETAPACELRLYHNQSELKKQTSFREHRLEASFDLTSFKKDTTTLSYQLVRGKEQLQEGTLEVVRLQDKDHTVQIDLLTGGLLVDRAPFFPFGFYCGPVGDLPEREVVHGFNLLGPYQHNLPEGLPERKAYMDRCAQVGMKVQYSVNSLIGSGHNGSRGLDKSDEEKLQLLKSEVLAFRDHPALLSWYINDEPDGQGRPPAVLEAACQLIHELDPYHPVSVVFMMPSKADEFRHTMDIAMTDPYPIPGSADEVLQRMEQYTSAYRYEKSVWLVPQAFGGQEGWRREPTAQEMRLMTYMGLLSGAKGIQYYVRGQGNTNPQSVSAWATCSSMAVEVAQMAPFLWSAEAGVKIISADDRILAKGFRYQDDLLILAINQDNTPKSFTLHTQGVSDQLGDQAELWFEDRSVPYINEEIADIIDAFGTRVYLIRNAGKQQASMISPGNLIVNPGFEKVESPGLPIGFNRTYGSFSKQDFGATVFADPGQHVEGLFSLRMITPTDSGGNKVRMLPIVINKGDSYLVSFWAKAAKQPNMPEFSLGIDALDSSHSFHLTEDWKQYSFVFTAAASFTNAIVSLQMPDAGTAWIDLVQVTPVPVIGYEIDQTNEAQVHIEGSYSGGRIRYAIDREPDSKSPVYKSPFTIQESATVYAAIFEGGEQVAGAKKFIPLNEAWGKPVSLDEPFSEQYQAHGSASLTDGLMGATSFKDKNWLGFGGKNLVATIDLREVTRFNEVTGSFLCDPNSGIFLPPVTKVFTSSDGEHFEWAGELTNDKGNIRGEPYLQTFTVHVKNAAARYIRLEAKAFGRIPEGYLFTGSVAWLFADEILVK